MYIRKFGDMNVTPYIHVVVCHSITLLDRHGSISKFSQQGFEATHAWHCKLYYSSTSHDGGVKKAGNNINSSILQVLNKCYRIVLLQAILHSKKSQQVNNFLSQLNYLSK